MVEWNSDVLLKGKSMKISYDKEIDALYIRLIDTEMVAIESGA
jgi:hypothetical protein